MLKTPISPAIPSLIPPSGEAEGVRGRASYLPGLLLIALVLAAYFPSLRGEFLWDDDSNVVKSAPLRSLAGLAQIWLRPGATQQYYPLTHSSFWLDFHLWGLHAWPYHAENILLHASSSALLWLLLRHLGVKGAWLAAALFALHPVNVESVAWITERKNSLSGVFFISSMLAAVKFWRLDILSPSPPPFQDGGGKGGATGHGLESRVNASTDRLKTELRAASMYPWKFYLAALGLFLCALLSKTATIGLPAVMVLLIWWKRGALVRRDFFLLLPFIFLAVAFGLITMGLEKDHLGASGPAWGYSLAARYLIAGRAIWFYLGKLLWPHPLMFMYPQWTIRASQITAYIPLFAAIAGLSLLWLKAERRPPAPLDEGAAIAGLSLKWPAWARPVLVASIYFIVMLFPVLGFFNVVFYYYSFVCDHFQYLACIGPLALAAAGITLAFDKFGVPPLGGIDAGPPEGGTPNKNIQTACEPISADSSLPSPPPRGGKGGASWRWSHVSLQSTSAVLLLILGLLTWRQAHVYRDAETLWRDTLAHNPDSWMAHDNLGTCFSLKGQFSEAAVEYLKALKLRPEDYMAWNDLGLDAARLGQLDDAAKYFTQALQFLPNYALGHYNFGNVLARKENYDEAIEQFNLSLQLDPYFAPAHYSLANALARKGDVDKAIEHYHSTLELDPDFAPAHANLGRVFAARTNFDEAIAHYRAALKLDPKSVEALANLGNALVAQKHYDEAIGCYRAALQIATNSALIHYNLGVALDRQGSKAQAQKELAEATRLQAQGNAK